MLLKWYEKQMMDLNIKIEYMHSNEILDLQKENFVLKSGTYYLSSNINLLKDGK